MNSGSFTRSANSRQTVLWTNCEAAIEISRQMKLRNIGGVIVVDFIDMESRRDQFQLLEHFSSAIKDDSARPQIAQLTELGLVELTRKRQGQNIYELFGKKCENCNGLGHIENFLNFQNSELEIKNFGGKINKSNDIKLQDLDPANILDKQEKVTAKDLKKSKNDNKDDIYDEKENENDVLNSFNSKDKKVITIELNNDEKIVFSQLGINPLIKLGKDYLNSNNTVLIEDDTNKAQDTITKNDSQSKTKLSSSKQSQKILKSQVSKDRDLNSKSEVDTKNQLTKTTEESQEFELKEKENNNEITDELNNARKKRRRSSASLE